MDDELFEKEITHAVAVERETCARIASEEAADEKRRSDEVFSEGDVHDHAEAVAKRIAYLIRNRGKS